jgi:hypothetical protein
MTLSAGVIAWSICLIHPAEAPALSLLVQTKKRSGINFLRTPNPSPSRSGSLEMTSPDGSMEGLRMLVTKRTKINGTTTRLLLAAMTLLVAITVPAFAQGPEQGNSAREIKVPVTAKDHYEMAEYYRKIEAQARQEVEMHQKMLAEFSKGVAKSSKDSNENPYIKNMRLHCEKYIKAAETLEVEAAESAKFHILRAKELEGK